MTNKTSEAIRAILRYIALPLTVAGILIAAILLTPMKEKATVIPSTASSQTEPDVPPMDANAPIETEAATFAMG